MSRSSIRRETDADLINRIANDASVLPFIRADGQPIDLSAIAAKQTAHGCVILSNGADAIALFEMTAPDIFESHTLFGPTCRGREAIKAGRAMVQWMFDRGVKRVWGVTPFDNRKAAWFNRQIGACVIGKDKQGDIFVIDNPDSRVFA